MNSEEYGKMIDATNFWDTKLLDMKIEYLGDEVRIIYGDKTDEFAFEVVLTQCYEVKYNTDANFRLEKFAIMKEKKYNQLGYFIQDISVKESEDSGFFEVNFNCSPFDMNVTCKKIEVKKMKFTDLSLFWSEN